MALLEGYAEGIPAHPPTEPLPSSIADLKVIRTAIGVLLNSSIGYGEFVLFLTYFWLSSGLTRVIDPVKARLNSLEVATTIMKLSAAIYPTGAWLNATSTGTPEAHSEIWTLRSGLSNWAWRTISELKDEGMRHFSHESKLLT